MSVSLVDGHIDDDTWVMTDDEVVKALERCINKDHVVFWHYDKFINGTPITVKDVCRVITNLKAEIERLNGISVADGGGKK